jgi:methylglutaconyl-CoA hydratase
MVVRIERNGGGVVRVILNRPDVRNAFDAELIVALTTAFRELGADPSVRVVILAGAGKHFCGGADLNWMRAALDLSAEENIRDAERLAAMFGAIDTCPHPVIGRVHGAALGGGAGLAAVCDIVVSSADAIFGFPETKLGLVPAVIAPFVLAKIGSSAARSLFVTGERFSAERAQLIGLVHEVMEVEHLDARIAALTAECATASPSAIAAAKRLIADLRDSDKHERLDVTTRAIATARVSRDGQEGVRAFLERRPPSWATR